MDGQEEARIIAMALLRGLIGPGALRDAATREGASLLEALREQGVLDETDIDLLGAIPAEPAPPRSFRGATEEETDAAPLAGDGDGRQVREALGLDAWKDYQDLTFVAEGGLGRIFRAFDPRLRRFVALKFLRGDEPELIRRFVLEAQHQATVEHPNICKVYDVGEWKGQAFIAMQFIEGETLDLAGPRMSMMEKVEALETAAEAVHAAHRQGLIHRDIKPANIMVERAGDGRSKLHLLDFGLARNLEMPGLTLHGVVMGTTNYMAPEQALGLPDQVGRRTDVYGLGATLYRLLTGRMLFQGTSVVDILRRTVEEEPERPSTWVPGLPRDLEAIVLRCLEKDPLHRYDSARALAEDLRRFREGEPIMARPATRVDRLVKLAKRHRAMFTVSTAAVLLVAILGGWGLSSSLRARQAAGFAASYGAEAERFATTLRMAQLLPRHDIRPGKRAVRARMEELRENIGASGRLAAGPGAFALGQGHLALREFQEARLELERAWNLGYRDPKVAQALGLALGELYREARGELVQIGDLDQRKVRERELRQQFRDPALVRLRFAATGIPERRAYLEGLLAYFEDSFPVAILQAQEAFRQDPQFYEAKLLEGRALIAHGLSLQDADPEAFQQRLEEAREPLRIALEMGRSDPAVLAAEGQRRSELARYRCFYEPCPVVDYAGIQAWFDQVLHVDPDDAETYLAKARLAGAHAFTLGEHGDDPSQVLDEAIGWCRTASRITQGQLSTSASLGELYRWRVIYERSRGLDASSTMDRMFACWQEAICQRPGDPWLHQRLADAWTMRGDMALEEGQDPQAFLNRGLYHIRESLRLAGSGTAALSGANLQCGLGDWKREHGQDPVPHYEQALAYYDLALAKAPEDGDIHSGITDVVVRYATHLRQIGKPCDVLLKRGLEAAEHSIVLSPTYFRLLNQGDCLRTAAQARLDEGLDPKPLLSRAWKSLDVCERMNPDGDYTLYWYQGLLALVEGKAAALGDRDPDVAWTRAEQCLRRAIRMNPRAIEPLVALTRLAWERGRWLSSRRRAFRDATTTGMEATFKGFSLKPRQPELQALRGCLFRLQARAQAEPGARGRLLGLARHDLETALAENRFLLLEFGPELEQTKAELAARL